MATFYVTHHLQPDNPHLFVIDVQQVVKPKGEFNTSFWQNSRGESYWEIAIYTSGMDSDGYVLGPYWIDVYDTEQSINDLVNNKVEEICGEIDWSRSHLIEDSLLEQADLYAPIVSWQYPSAGQINVPIDSRIVIRLRELLPAKGIDISTLTFKVGGFFVSPDITGNPYDYTISYRPHFSK